MSPRRRLLVAAVLVTPPLLALLGAVLVLLWRQGGLAPFDVPAHGAAPRTSATLVERGRYLATLGNCVGCHTAPGGAQLAGGRAFETGYGTVYSTNLTPDPGHGIGAWSADEFRHAMRHGVSRRGVMSPVFPYASFRRLTDDDLDALLAWLLTAPASDAPRRANALTFPASLPGAMVGWRMLYLRPVAPRAPADPALARGAYLVEGIGHCATCHASRGAFASRLGVEQLWGERSAGWFAPALHGAALQRFDAGDVARYLTGVASDATGAYGPMADVVARNLQWLTDADAAAIEAYLRVLPPPPGPVRSASPRRLSAETLATGLAVYERHCADCHGTDGEGVAGRYPPLRGSPAIVQDDPVNLIRLIVLGAVAPATAANPAPYTMPPFAHQLGAAEIAALASVLRAQQNPAAAPIDAADVHALGGGAWGRWAR